MYAGKRNKSAPAGEIDGAERVVIDAIDDLLLLVLAPPFFLLFLLFSDCIMGVEEGSVH